MKNKTLKLVDQRTVTRGAVRQLRSIIKQIDDGLVTSVSISTVRRDGTVFVYSKSECQVKTLGSLELLKEYIIRTKFGPT